MVVGVIPARFASTRFPGKPLARLRNKPLLQWVIEGARQSRRLDRLMVATDNSDIAQLAQACGTEVVMTSTELATGSDRVWAAVKAIPADIVVNIQGDEPLIEARVVDALIEAMGPRQGEAAVEMATLARSLNANELLSPQVAKIVLNARGEALYFSRLPIPYSKWALGSHAESEGELVGFGAESFQGAVDGCLKHIGIYAYRRDFLQKFCAQPPVAIEQAESLEQLRALYLGARIRVAQVENYESWGVDLPADLEQVEAILQHREQRK